MSLINVQWRALGQHYGYPRCCVDAFLSDTCQVTKDRYPDAPWDGTGFIPCPCCAERAIEDFDAFVATTITPARRTEASFPDEGCDDESWAAVEAAWYQLTWSQRQWYRLSYKVEQARNQFRYAITYFHRLPRQL
jgi:hypothetical protein